MGPAPRRAAFDGVSVLLLAQPGGPLLDGVLDDLVRQRPHPDQVVAVGLAPDSQEARMAGAHALFSGPAASSLVLLPGVLSATDAEPTPTAAAVSAAAEHLPRDPARWVWVLHDDSAPRPGALEALVDVARRSARVRVVGPKLVRTDDPRLLLSVGHRLTRSGRLVAEDGPSLVDQGQFDDRSDVIGVPLPGLLVRSDVFAEIGGVDPAFDEGTEGLDLCWRAHLRGHRVMVAPRAVVGQGSAGLGRRSPSRYRRRVRQLALARGSMWGTPWRAARLSLGAVLAALALLLVKRPRDALAELADLGAVAAPGRSLGARWRFRGSRLVQDRDLRGLFEPARSGWRSTGDTLHDAVVLRSPATGVADQDRSGVESGPGAVGPEEASDHPSEGRGWWSWGLTVAVLVSAGVSLVRWRGLLGGLSPSGSGVHGGELEEVRAGASEVWSAWLLPWSGAGLGTGTEGPAWLLPMAGAGWLAEHLPGGPGSAALTAAGVTTAWLLFLAPPAAALTAYLAARVAGRHRGLRTVVALTWATLAPLWVSVDQGRVGPVVVHVLAPVIVAGAVLALDRTAPARRTTTVVLVAALAAAAAVWWVPGVLVWLVLLSLVIVLWAPGRGRWRAALFLAIPAVLWGPWVLRLLERPLLLAGGPGATASGDAVPVWQTLLLHAGGPPPPVLWWTAPLWVVALWATAAPGRRGARATSALGCALCGLGPALVAPWLHWGQVPTGHPDAGSVVSSWPGTYLSLTGAGVLLAAACGAARLGERPRGLGERPPGPGVRRRVAPVTLAVGAVVVLVAVIASLGTLGWRAFGTPPATLRVADGRAPAVVAEQVSGPSAPRWLDLTSVGAAEGFAVRYRLSGAEPDPWVRDRVRELVTAREAAARPRDLTVATEAVRQLVDGDLVTGSGAARSEEEIPPALADLAVGYVTANASPDHPVVARIDEVPGLTRITTPERTAVLWRVLPVDDEVGGDTAEPGRVRLQTAEGQQTVLPSEAHGTVRERPIEVPDSGGDAATLLLAEPSSWSGPARVRADGELLPGHGGLPVRYDIPAGAQTVSVTLPPAHRLWWSGTALLAAVLVFLALPLGAVRAGRSR